MSKEKYELCLRITSDALEGLDVVKKSQVSETYMRFISDYVADGKHYAEKGDYPTALEAMAYAHGFIDAGVLAGFFSIPDYHLGAL